MLNIISIIILFVVILINKFFQKKEITIKKHNDYSLWIIILILSTRIFIEILYSDSSWYFKPLIKGQYLMVYLWYEGPIFMLLFVLPFYTIVIKELFKKGIRKFINNTFSNLSKKLFIGLKGIIGCVLLLFIYGIVAYALETIIFNKMDIFIAQDKESFRESLIRFSHSSLLNYLFIIDDILLFPIGEELFFRGYCYIKLKKHVGIRLGIIISSLIFSFYHQDIGAIIPYFLIGVILAMVYEQSKSLIPSFLIHILYNFIMFIFR